MQCVRVCVCVCRLPSLACPSIPPPRGCTKHVQVPEVRDKLEQVLLSKQATQAVLDDEAQLTQPHAYCDAVNSLEADLAALNAVVAKGANYMWGLKYARDTEFAHLTAAEEALEEMQAEHELHTVPKCTATVIDQEQRHIQTARDVLLDAKTLLRPIGEPPEYFPTVEEATAAWKLKVQEACSAVARVNETMKEHRKQQAIREQQQREIYAQTMVLTEK